MKKMEDGTSADAGVGSGEEPTKDLLYKVVTACTNGDLALSSPFGALDIPYFYQANFDNSLSVGFSGAPNALMHGLGLPLFPGLTNWLLEKHNTGSELSLNEIPEFSRIAKLVFEIHSAFTEEQRHHNTSMEGWDDVEDAWDELKELLAKFGRPEVTIDDLAKAINAAITEALEPVAESEVTYEGHMKTFVDFISSSLENEDLSPQEKTEAAYAILGYVEEAINLSLDPFEVFCALKNCFAKKRGMSSPWGTEAYFSELVKMRKSGSDVLPQGESLESVFMKTLSKECETIFGDRRVFHIVPVFRDSADSESQKDVIKTLRILLPDVVVGGPVKHLGSAISIKIPNAFDEDASLKPLFALTNSLCKNFGILKDVQINIPCD